MRSHYFGNEEQVRVAQADEFGFNNGSSSSSFAEFGVNDGFESRAKQLDQTGFVTFMSRVFGWMFLGLSLTAATSLILLNSKELFTQACAWMMPLLLVELILVWSLAGLINKISAFAATALFFVYAFANGVTLTPLLAIYTQSSVLNAFMATGATFGIMSVYGITTKKDLTHLGSLLMMGVVGLLFVMIFGLIFGTSGAMSIVISCAAVFIFVGLVAYDTQRLKVMYVEGVENTETGQKIAIMGALTLYLDFINIFIHLLKLIGERK